MYKMIVFDIDGTLMRYKVDNHAFEPKILDMFKKLKNNGYIVVLATGRDYVSIGNLHLSDNIDYFIGANGSFIFDAKLRKNVWNTKLSIEDFENYKYEILDKNIKYINNVILSDNKNVYVHSYEQLENHWFWKSFFDKFRKLDTYPNQMNADNFHLITINCLDKKIIDISKKFFEKNNSSLYVQAFWNNGFFVSEKNLNKGTTIERLAKYLKFTNNEIIAFGDGENDIQMIKMAGMGIAMENGINEIKNISDDIAKSVEEYGTYYKLKELGII